jgi:VWFA-related protein
VRRVFRVLLFCLLSTCCLAGRIIYLRVHRDVLEERVKASPQTGMERLHKLRAQFADAGCSNDALYEQAVPKQELPNLICNLPGKEPGRIVISAAMGQLSEGPEDETHWATLALLPLLAESVGHVPHRLSITFAAFSGQQHGLRGSSEYLRQLTKSQQQEIRAMVNLEDIGRTPLVYALAQEDLGLANWLTLSSTTLRVQSTPMEITPQSVDARLTNGAPVFNLDDYLVDAKTFQRDRIPAICLRSAPLPMVSAMRHAGAWPGNSSGRSFDLEVYEQTYNVLSVYLLYLDSNLNPHGPSPSGTQVAAVPPAASAAIGTESQTTGTAAPAPAVRAEEGSSHRTSTVPSAAPNSASALPGGPEKANAPSDISVFHADTQLVVMDVSVTDAKGNPVKGLQSGDFTLLENGKPQAIRVFEAHGSQTQNPGVAETSLPPGTYSNRISASTDSPLNIFLFDLLNTPPQDQAYAKSQMLQYLKTMPRGKHISLFVLSSHLQMVQGFTDDSETLMKTAEKLVRQASPLLTSEVQLQQDQGFTEEVGRYAMPSPPNGLPASVAASVASARRDAQSVTGFVSQRTATAARSESIRADQRTTLTLEALAAISRAVSGYPGRKNLVWLSGSFKIRLRPSDNSFLSVGNKTTQAAAAVSDLSSTYSYQEAIRTLTTAMATARIALYPIDVRGLKIGGVEIGVGTESTLSMVDVGNNDAYNHTLSSQSETRFGERSSMLDLAEQTGGHVFVDNDVRGSIARSLEDGSNYYTLAYTPDKNNIDKGFRSVQIKLSRGSVTLAYRPGYYPTPSGDSVKQSGAHMLAAAMQPGVPQSTMLSMTVHVLPPDATSKALRVDYSIDLNGVDFQDISDDQKRAVLDCMAVALDGKGNIAGQTANTMDAALRLQEFPAFQRTGLPMHQELVLPPGSYDLRIGVLDRASQKIGTINVPISISGEAKAN